MRIMNCIFMALIIVFAGCATKSIVPTGGSGPVQHIEKGSKVYVVIPDDGQYGMVRYSGSGRTVATMLKAALSPYVIQVVSGEQHEQCRDAFASAINTDAKYLFCPVITHWEDRNTAWSGRSDKVQIEISVYDVGAQTLLSSVGVYASGSGFAFRDHPPQALLPKPLSEYAQDLFQ